MKLGTKRSFLPNNRSEQSIDWSGYNYNLIMWAFLRAGQFKQMDSI